MLPHNSKHPQQRTNPMLACQTPPHLLGNGLLHPKFSATPLECYVIPMMLRGNKIFFIDGISLTSFVMVHTVAKGPSNVNRNLTGVIIF
jgi:hypothetical protein